MSALGLGCAKTPAPAAHVETSRRNCAPWSRIVLRARCSIPCRRIVFSTFLRCMSFHTGWVRSGHHPSPNQCPLYPSKRTRADIGHRPRHGSVACSDHWLRSVLAMVRLAAGQLVWIDATPQHTGYKRKTLGEILERRFDSALFLACNGGLLQIELALDASARLVGNFALSQQPVDECTLGGNQVGSEFRDSGSSFEPI